MRLRFSGLLIGLGLSLGVGMMSAQAQVSDAQVGALVEALRQAAPQTGRDDDGLYSDWQVQPQNIPRWSKSCIGRELTPEQFSNSPVTARSILVCVLRDVLKEEYQIGKSEPLAVRRAAAWWMTGDANRYAQGDTATYTQRVLTLYQKQRPISSAKPSAIPAAKPSATPTPAQPATPPAKPAEPTEAEAKPTLLYDRYMKAGYEATGRKDYATALLYFKRAMDERPNDPFAQKAITNVEAYQNSKPPASTPEASSSTAQPSTSGANP